MRLLSSSEKIANRDLSQWIVTGSICIMSVILIYTLSQNFSLSIDWLVDVSAPSQLMPIHQVSSGPFQLDAEAYVYTIQEKYRGGKINLSMPLVISILLLIWGGIMGVLAWATNLKRFEFIALMAIYLLMTKWINLDQLEVLGSKPGGYLATVLLMIAIVGPAYYFHAFQTQVSFWLRWLVIFCISLIPLLLAGFQTEIVPIYLLGQVFYPSVFFTVLLIFLVAEEVIFLILLLVTRSKGGQDNEKHFTILGILYLGYLIVYYLKKAGFIKIAFGYFNPYILLIVSVLIACYTLTYKQPKFDRFTQKFSDIKFLLLVLTMVGFGYLMLGFGTATDAAYESLHYVIIYVHLGFGSMFFIYIIANFINPMIAGLQVYKIAYNEQNFPYVTSKLGGLVIIAGCYFVSGGEVKNMLIGSDYAYKSHYYRTLEPRLGEQYLKESHIYAASNHFANYQLGLYYQEQNKLSDASYRFHRATSRFPSPHAFVNLANLQVNQNDISKGIKILRDGQIALNDDNKIIRHNLAYYLGQSGNQKEALELLSNLETDVKWSQSPKVNAWWIAPEQLDASLDFENGNLAVKTNIIRYKIRSKDWFRESQLAIQDFTLEGPSLYNTAFLTNLNLYSPNSLFASQSLDFLTIEENPEQKERLNDAIGWSFYRAGEVALAFNLFNQTARTSSILERDRLWFNLALISLEQGAYLTAMSYAEKINSNYPKHLLLTLLNLEAERWQDAAYHLRILENMGGQSEGSFVPLNQILQKRDDGSFAFFYYRWNEIPLVEWPIRLSFLTETEKTLLWKKIIYYLANQNDYTRLSAITEHVKEAPSSIIKLIQDINTSREASTPDYRNPFLPWRYTFTQNLSGDALLDHHNKLAEMLVIHPYSVALLQAYCFTSIDLGLYDYANDALIRLYDLMPLDRYREFERSFSDALYQQKQKSKDWIN